MSPFTVAKVLENVIGKEYCAKKRSSRDLLVEVQMKEQSVPLLSLKKIPDNPVSVSPHRSLNAIRGVVLEDDLLNSSEDEILEGLRDQGVVAVKRIALCRNDSEMPTKHVTLAFNSTTLPTAVKVGYLNCRVLSLCPKSSSMLPLPTLWARITELPWQIDMRQVCSGWSCLRHV